jgi:L-amino acid N-acyltransferase YncA
MPSDSVKIVKAKLADEKQILDLERRVWSEQNLSDVADKYDLGSFIRFGYVFVAKHQNKTVGAIIAIRTNKDDVFVGDWVVDKQHRGKQVGRALYQKLMDSVKGTSIITLVSSRYKTSVAAHKKLGFKEKRLIRDAYGVGEKENYHLLYRKNGGMKNDVG